MKFYLQRRYEGPNSDREWNKGEQVGIDFGIYYIMPCRNGGDREWNKGEKVGIDFGIYYMVPCSNGSDDV